MGKTITTYLIDGKPQGVRYVIISNRTCKMFMIPRTRLSDIKERKELKQPALYLLLGEEEDFRPKAYIGQCGNFCDRITRHNTKKDYWEKALVFIADNNAINHADVRYLEYLAVKTAGEAGRFDLSRNIQTPGEPNLSEHDKDTIIEFFEDIKFLTLFTGCRIFDVVTPKNNPLFYSKSKGSDIKGFYDGSDFTVLKGSILAAHTAPKFKNRAKREEFIREYTYAENKRIILRSDYTFKSPSTAASICLGRHTNGWDEWKDGKGLTLDEVYRKKKK